MAQENNIMSLWSCATKQCVTSNDIAHIKHTLPGLDECQCERLNRELPFRSYMENKIAEQNSDRSDLTYASMGAGKLLFDWVTLNKLIMHGTEKIVYVAIDQEYAPLISQLKKNRVHKVSLERLKQTPYAQAIQSFFDWFVQIKNSSLPFDTFSMFIYESFDAYFNACITHQEMQAHIYVDIDNDISIPDFECNSFYDQFYARGNTIFQHQCRMYYLFHADYNHNEYRHVLQAQIYSDSSHMLTASCKDEFGVYDITHTHRGLFTPEPILPFIYHNKKIGIQINDTIFLHDDTRYKSITILSKMLERPLQAVSTEDISVLIKEIPKLYTSQYEHMYTYRMISTDCAIKIPKQAIKLMYMGQTLTSFTARAQHQDA